jgi:polyhydroxyalkanoate synthesis regulator phasin
MKKFNKTKTIAITTTIITLLSASAVFAATTSQSPAQNQQMPKMSYKSGFDGGLKSRLDSLVSSGTLTSAQETAIVNGIPQRSANDHGKQGPKDGRNPFDNLVSAGTITSDQETAIQNAMQTARQSGTKTDMKTVLDGLVTTGTITADQETAIVSAMPQRSANDHGKQGPKDGKNPLDNLVSAGTITSDQETAIQNAMQIARQSGTKTDMKTVLDGLVTVGTITADQETAIISGMPQHQENNGFETALDKLVKAGTITQAQEDAILIK